MNTLTYFLFYVGAYCLDMFSALFFRSKNLQEFNKVESNVYFSAYINKYGKLKGILLYTITIHLQLFIITSLAISIAWYIIFVKLEWIILSFIFVYWSIVHLLGCVTNVIALAKAQMLNPQDNPLKEENTIEKEVK